MTMEPIEREIDPTIEHTTGHFSDRTTERATKRIIHHRDAATAPTVGELERSLSQRSGALYRQLTGQQPRQLISHLFSSLATIVIEQSTTPTETLLLEGSESELAQQVRGHINRLIRREFQTLAEEILDVKIQTVLIDSALETGHTGLLLILSETPRVRNPSAIPKTEAYRRGKKRVPHDRDLDDRDDKLRLYEERLVANKVRQKSGEVTIGKRVDTGTATIDMPLEKERVVIERSTPDQQPAISGTHAFDSGEVARMELHEEQAKTRKETFVREEVSVRKENAQDTVKLKEQVRRETLDVDGDANMVQR